MGFFSNSDERYVVIVENYSRTIGDYYDYQKKLQRAINAQADKGYRLHSFSTTYIEDHGVFVNMVFEKM